MANYDCAIPVGVGVANNYSVTAPYGRYFDSGVPVGAGSDMVSVPAHNDYNWNTVYFPTCGVGNTVCTFQPTEFFYDCYYEQQLGAVVEKTERIREVPLLTRILP